jgi:hypothetical protein
MVSPAWTTTVSFLIEVNMVNPQKTDVGKQALRERESEFKNTQL